MGILLGADRAALVDAGLAGITIEWLGWDGSVWNLTSGEQGVILQPGFEGLSMPPIQRFEREGPAVHGSYYQGFRVQTRSIFLPLKVMTSSEDTPFWTDLDAMFFRTVRPDKVGVLRVTNRLGEAREITCRFDSDGSPAYPDNPAVNGVAVYALRLVANEPLWRGPEISKAIPITTGTPTITTQFANPGDIGAYVRWTIKGPFTTINVGIGAQEIKIPFSITSAQTLTIDTSPLDMRVMRNGVNVTNLLTTPPIYSILPADTNAQITAAGTGSTFGTVTANLSPLYYRAW